MKAPFPRATRADASRPRYPNPSPNEPISTSHKKQKTASGVVRPPMLPPEAEPTTRSSHSSMRVHLGLLYRSRGKKLRGHNTCQSASQIIRAGFYGRSKYEVLGAQASNQLVILPRGCPDSGCSVAKVPPQHGLRSPCQLGHPGRRPGLARTVFASVPWAQPGGPEPAHSVASGSRVPTRRAGSPGRRRQHHSTAMCRDQVLCEGQEASPWVRVSPPSRQLQCICCSSIVQAGRRGCGHD